MNHEEWSCLQHILDRYANNQSKEVLLERALYNEKFRLLYEWIQNREISLQEFLRYIKKIQNSSN
jgi:hypothetical protein